MARQWFSFDPTVHAGHIITACAVVFTAGGVYAALQADIQALKQTADLHGRQTQGIEHENKIRDEKWQDKLEQITKEQNSSIVKLRDDMNAWFVRLDNKLDNKADKP